MDRDGLTLEGETERADVYKTTSHGYTWALGRCPSHHKFEMLPMFLRGAEGGSMLEVQLAPSCGRAAPGGYADQ